MLAAAAAVLAIGGAALAPGHAHRPAVGQPPAATTGATRAAGGRVLADADRVTIGRTLARRSTAAVTADPVTRADGQVIRWNPCRAITYRVNAAHTSAGALRDRRDRPAIWEPASRTLTSGRPRVDSEKAGRGRCCKLHVSRSCY